MSAGVHIFCKPGGTSRLLTTDELDALLVSIAYSKHRVSDGQAPYGIKLEKLRSLDSLVDKVRFVRQEQRRYERLGSK